MARREIHEIRLLVEANSDDVESLADQVAQLACPEEHQDPNSLCRWRWFVVTRQLDAGEAEEWSEVLNE